MKALARLACGALIMLSIPMIAPAADTWLRHMFLCRSPILAFDFWNALLKMHQQGVTVTTKIAQEVCDGLKAGDDPQCIRVDAGNFKPVASGWQGAIAMTDGKTKVWFHNPDSLGWIHPDYYVKFVNSK